MFKNRTVVIIVGLMLIFNSCSKPVGGCTDADATNYDNLANEEDGSCIYAAKLSFWYSTATRDSILANSHESVTPYIDESHLINIYPLYLTWATEPDCQTNAIGIAAELGQEKGKWINFKVALDSLSNVFWEDSLWLTANACGQYEIVW